MFVCLRTCQETQHTVESLSTLLRASTWRMAASRFLVELSSWCPSHREISGLRTPVKTAVFAHKSHPIFLKVSQDTSSYTTPLCRQWRVQKVRKPCECGW